MNNKLVLLIALIFLMGCTIVEMQKENQLAQNRITQKEDQLDALEIERQRLVDTQRDLVAKLDEGQLTLTQLNAELDGLIRQNEQLVRLKKERQEDEQDVKLEIQNLKARKRELALLEKEKLSETSKAKEIKVLQEEIRNYLILGLKSKHRQNLQ